MKRYKIFCDGFLKHDGMVNGSSLAVLKGTFVEEGSIQYRAIFLLEDSLPKIKKLIGKNPTAFTMEYFALYNAAVTAKVLAKKQKRVDFIFSDAEVIVNQIQGVYQVTKKHHRKLRDTIQELLPEETKVLWTTRKANVKILGH